MAALETAHPTAPVDGIHLAVTQLYAISKVDMFMSTVLGKASTDASWKLNVTLPNGATVAQPVVTKVSNAFLAVFLKSVLRETLVFNVWDLVR